MSAVQNNPETSIPDDLLLPIQKGWRFFLREYTKRLLVFGAIIVGGLFVLALYVLVKRLASTNLPTEMSLFDSRFWLVLIIATIGGFLVAIIRVVTDKQRNELTTSLAIVSVVRDTLAGIGASFIVLTMSQAVNKSNIGLLLVAFVASLGGTGIINQFLLSQGYKDERNLFGSATTTDDNVELLKSELERIRHELEMIQVNLSDKQSADDMSFDVGEGN